MVKGYIMILLIVAGLEIRGLPKALVEICIQMDTESIRLLKIISKTLVLGTISIYPGLFFEIEPEKSCIFAITVMSIIDLLMIVKSIIDESEFS